MSPRTLTGKQGTARAGATPKFRGQGLYWLVKTAWSSIGTKYYSMRAFSPDPGITPIPILEEAPACPAALDIGISASPISGNTSLVLRNEPLRASGIESVLLDAVSPEGTPVDVYLIFDPRDGSALAEADWILINSYTIDSPPKYGYGSRPTVSFSLIDRIESAGAKGIGRLISRDLFLDRNLPARSLGRMIPIIYGEVLGARALPVVEGHVTELDGAIEDNNTTIFVKSVEGFDATDGRLKIDAEPMTYTSVTTGINASFNGVTRGPSPEEHSDGSSVIEVLDLYEYILTDHVNDDVANTRVNGKAVTTNTVEGTLDGKTVTYLTLPALPTIAEFSNVAQTTPFFGPTGWADDGPPNTTTDSYIRSGGEFQLVANNATGAIDEEPDGVTFALFDPPEGKTDLSATFSQNLTGRAAFLTGLNLVVTYQIVPGENLPAAIEDFPWPQFFTKITRDSVEIALEDVPKPSPLQIRGFLDRQEFLPGIQDSRFLFGVRGFGSQYSADPYIANIPFRDETLWDDTPFSIGQIRLLHWPTYFGAPQGSRFIQPTLSARDVQVSGGTPPLISSKRLDQALFGATYGPSVTGITKLSIKIDLEGAGGASTGEINFALPIEGFETLTHQEANLNSGALKTVTLEYESEFAPLAEATGNTLQGFPSVTNIDIDVTEISEGTLVTGEALHPGSKVTKITGQNSFDINQGARADSTGGNITLRDPNMRQELDIRKIGVLAIDTSSESPQTFGISEPIVTKIFRLQYWIRAIRWDYWTKDETNQVGLDTPLQTTITRIANALLASASDKFQQRIRMTAFARSGFGDPWEFFAEPQTVEIGTLNPSADLGLIVSNIEWEVVEKPSVTRQLRESEIVLTADVRGITDGGLLEDPEAIITHVLEDSDDGWGLPSADIDGTGLTAALVGRENWKFARPITEVTTGKALLAEACRDANIRYVQDGGKIRFTGNLFPVFEDVPASSEITRDLIMPDLSKDALHRDLTVTDIRINFKRDPVGLEFLEFFEATAPVADVSNAGAQQTSIDALWIRDRATAEGLANRILNEASTSPQIISLSTVAMWGAHLLATDIVSVTDSGTLLSLPGTIVGRNTQRGENCSFSIIARQILVRVWTAIADETTYIDAYHGSRLVFVINGVKVAVLDMNAAFSLKGGIESAIVIATQTELIEKLTSPDRISFATDKGNFPPNRNQVGQVTSAGVLQVQLFKTNSLFPTTPGPPSPFTDYIVEQNTGGALAAAIFSANKEQLICNMALAVIEAGRFVYDPNM